MKNIYLCLAIIGYSSSVWAGEPRAIHPFSSSENSHGAVSLSEKQKAILHAEFLNSAIWSKLYPNLFEETSSEIKLKPGLAPLKDTIEEILEEHQKTVAPSEGLYSIEGILLMDQLLARKLVLTREGLSAVYGAEKGTQIFERLREILKKEIPVVMPGETSSLDLTDIQNQLEAISPKAVQK